MFEIQEELKKLPGKPGVYIMHDEADAIIYVGKAISLKNRVRQYFQSSRNKGVKIEQMVTHITRFEYIVTDSELEALVLECNLIKEHRPKYNTMLMDDKGYPFIRVTADEDFPRIMLARKMKKDRSKYFGPYTEAGAARAVLELARELYPIRACRIPITPDTLARGKGRLCLEYHLKRCKGCCVGKISHEDYARYIENIRLILRGDTGELMDYLRGEMERLSSELRFEEAQDLKVKYQLVERYRAKSVIVSQTLDSVDVFGLDDDDSDVYINYMHVRRGAVVRSVTLQYKRRMEETQAQLLSYAMDEVRSRFGLAYDEVIVPLEPDAEFPGATFTVPQRGDKAKLLDVSTRNARQSKLDVLKQMERLDPEKRTGRTLERMKADFRLNVLPRHIECFDNSNIQGTNPVASCVVFRDAKPSKKDYRHFNIKTVEGPDDFASMKEVLTRRYTRLMEEAPDDLPQLIVVDGGKGQLSAAVEALDEIGLRGTIAVVGIAKRLEEIFFPGDSVPLYIDKNSESLRVVQQLRDEAHRFGITHHRNRRSKSAIVSELSQIKGVGPGTEQALLSHFKSVKRIREASLDALADVVGPAKARVIRDHFAGREG